MKLASSIRSRQVWYRASAILALGLVALAWTQSHRAVHPSVWRSVVPFSWDTLDPVQAGRPSSLLVIQNTMEGLTEWDTREGLQPALAKGWVESPDHKSFQFSLRRGVFLHDGSPLRAREVLESLERLKSAPGTRRRLLQAVKEIEAISPYEIRFDLHRPMPSLPLVLASPPAKIAVPRQGGWIGTGPFQLQQLKPVTLLERFHYYWGTAPELEHLEFYAPDSAEAAEMALAMEIEDLPAGWNTIFSSAPSQGVVSERGEWATWVLGFNQIRGLFADKQCRAQWKHHWQSDEFLQAFFAESFVAKDLVALGGPDLGREPDETSSDSKPLKGCDGKITLAVPNEIFDSQTFTEWVHNTLGPQIQIKVLALAELQKEVEQAKVDAFVIPLASEVPDPAYLLHPLQTLLEKNVSAKKNKELNHFAEQLDASRTMAERAFVSESLNSFVRKDFSVVPLAHPRAQAWQRDCVQKTQNSPLSWALTSYKEAQNNCSTSPRSFSFKTLLRYFSFANL